MHNTTRRCIKPENANTLSDLDEMERLPGIDADRVQLFGAHYLPLIAQVSEQFQSIYPSTFNKINSGVITISDDEGVLDDGGIFANNDFEDDENSFDGSADSPFNDNGAAFAENSKIDRSSFDRV